MFARTSALLALPLALFFVFPAPAAAAGGGGDPRVEAAVEVAQMILPHVKRWLTESTTGQSAEARVLKALPETQLVIGRKTFTVTTEHWDANKLGKVRLSSSATCEAFYAIDTSKIRCDFQPGKKVLRVSWPAARVLTVTPDLETHKVMLKGSLLRPALLNPEVVRKLRAEAPKALKRAAAEAAREHADEVQSAARRELHRLLRELVRDIDRDIEVKLD